MKKTLLFLGLGLLLSYSLLAQTTSTLPTEKTITVTGSSEMKVTPDEIYFSVMLKEYMKDKNKVEIEKLEKELQQAVISSGIPKENFMIQQLYGEKWKRKKYKDAELLTSKTYVIKVAEPGKIDEILDKINPQSIEQVYLSHYSHSKIHEYKKQLKIEAIKAAKEKAGYLLEAINEKLGEAIEVSESDATFYPTITGFYAENDEITNNEYRQYIYDDKGGYEASGIGFQEIELKFYVAVKFRIK